MTTGANSASHESLSPDGSLGRPSSSSSCDCRNRSALSDSMPAVCVRGGHHGYVNITFNGKTVVPALRDLNMTVRQGEIYALLGASGCGKTTILRAMVGQHKLNAGTVRVFGKEPRSPGSGIPGPVLGYMPQELAVYEGFTISETMRFFGWLAGMSSDAIQEKTDAILKLLDLPFRDRYVGDLSGGQQRRVSFAVALIHSPPLLILDEPTVGLDPIIREGIWEHLLEITRAGRTTVVITTHYIEEARQASMVGLMRHGAILEEAQPGRLLEKYSCDTLEDVLLKLCLRQEAQQPTEISEPLELDNRLDDEYENSNEEIRKFLIKSGKPKERIRALIYKNLKWFRRHSWITFLLIFLPWLITGLYCTSVGNRPTRVDVAVVNQESDCIHWTSKSRFNCPVPTDISCLFQERMRAHNIVPVPFPDEGAGRRSVLEGKAWALVMFASNYSESLLERFLLGVGPGQPPVTSGLLDNGAVSVHLDMSYQPIGYMLYSDLTTINAEVLVSLNAQCETNPHVIRPPIMFQNPAMGVSESTFLDYSIPGLILSVVFMFGMTTTMSTLLPEKSERSLERVLVCGVRVHEVIISQFVVQLVCVMIPQATGVLVVSFVLFRISQMGSYYWYVAMVMWDGVFGMAFGFLLAVVFDSTTTASLIGTGAYFTFLFLSTMLWPKEGMHQVLRWVADVLPITASTVSLRNMALRAWDVSFPGVYAGFLSTTIWTGAVLVVIFITIKLRY